MWARERFAASVDTLFVDEAGQLSLANVLAIAGAARKPRTSGRSATAGAAKSGGASTGRRSLGAGARPRCARDDARRRRSLPRPDIPDASRRCARYSSEVFYDGRLQGVDGLENQAMQRGRMVPRGVRPARRRGCARGKHERIEGGGSRGCTSCTGLVGVPWTDKDGVTPDDQRRCAGGHSIQRADSRDRPRPRVVRRPGVRVGTVDKFQGQEAPAVVYSMATSSANDAPRGLEFLFDLHRLNVATSRARAVAIIVASPDLVRVFCGTPRQMQLANALCRAWEI